MGIDACINVIGPVTQEMIDTANGLLRDMGLVTEMKTYNNTFIMGREERWGVDLPPFAEFMSMWRYWGPDYERGPLFSILGVLCIAIKAFPGCTVRYSGDSADWDEGEEVTPEFMGSLLAHFMGPNGNAYREHFRVAESVLRTFRHGL